MQHPQEVRQAREGHNTIPQEEQQHLDPPRETNGAGETNRARERGPYIPPGGEDCNEGMLDGSDTYRQGMGAQSWEQKFKDIQQELNYMKEAVKGRALVSIDTLVQQTESLFTAGVLHFPLPAKFRMPQIKTFDGTKGPIDHLNTYKNQMELHGYQDPI